MSKRYNMLTSHKNREKKRLLNVEPWGKSRQRKEKKAVSLNEFYRQRINRKQARHR